MGEGKITSEPPIMVPFDDYPVDDDVDDHHHNNEAFSPTFSQINDWENK